TVDAIAKRAAVSRTTIYKWWPSSAAIVLEGLLDSVGDPLNAPPGSSCKEALEHHLRALNAILTDSTTGPLLRDVVAAAAADPATARAWVSAPAADPSMARAVLDQWLHPRRAALAAVVRQAVAQGEFRDGTDVEVIVDALVSPPYYRLLFALSPLDDAALNDLLETVWRGCRGSDALPSTAHAVAAARSITASGDQRART